MGRPQIKVSPIPGQRADDRPQDSDQRVDHRCGVLRSRAPQRVQAGLRLRRSGLGVPLGPALAMPLGADEALSGALLARAHPASPDFGEDELQLVSTFR